jgi:hypothetical protein
MEPVNGDVDADADVQGCLAEQPRIRARRER